MNTSTTSSSKRAARLHHDRAPRRQRRHARRRPRGPVHLLAQQQGLRRAADGHRGPERRPLVDVLPQPGPAHGRGRAARGVRRLLHRGTGQRGPGRRRGPAGPGHAHGQHRGPAQPAHPELPGFVGHPRHRGFQLRAVPLPGRLLRQQIRPRPAQPRIGLPGGRGPCRHAGHPHRRGARTRASISPRAWPRASIRRAACPGPARAPTTTTGA